MTDLYQTAAFGGAGWSPRERGLGEETGEIWGPCGSYSESSPLKRVLMHRPGAELRALSGIDSRAELNAALMLSPPDAEQAAEQHDAVADAYRTAGVEVVYVEPSETPPPNQMYVADLLFMTPEGAILARPASTARAGEERWVARRLAELGIPIVRSISGRGAFEGADAAWLDPRTVLLGRGMRTNAEGAAQVRETLARMGVEVIEVDLPFGTMHMMGHLRFGDGDLAFAWRGRLAVRAVEALRDRGYDVRFFPDHPELREGFAHNIVTLGPRHILMPACRPTVQRFYEDAGVTCLTVEVDALLRAAGGMGCLTGILEREPC